MGFILEYDPLSPQEQRARRLMSQFAAGESVPLSGPDGKIDESWIKQQNVSEPYTCPLTVLVAELVYSTGVDAVDQAAANIASPAIGIVLSKPSGVTAIVQFDSEFELLSGLTPGAIYYMSEVAGAITDVAPAASGTIVQPVGVARSSSVLVLNISDFEIN